ncbi:hypothetical protein [Actinomadura sp. GTD37]|uniref:hypothetical protein n=1 Tax=Actinomadura sp. GTD37 TaxID=1778030 RepID=UPI0035BFFC3C
MTEFREGDRVNITIENALVTNTFRTGRKPLNGPHEDTGTVLVYRHPDEGVEDRSHTVNLNAEGVTVEHAAPDNWPPRRNDVWRHTGGALWFAFQVGSNVTLVNGEGETRDQQEAWEQRRQLRLEYREPEPVPPGMRCPHRDFDDPTRCDCDEARQR